MAFASHLSDTSRAAAPFAHLRGPLLALLLFAVPAAAWADIYKWTDEKGRTVLSNVAPAKSATVRNFELVAKEAPPAARAPATVPPHVATPTEQALLARIESLERQLQATQYAAQAAAMPPPAYYGGYYPPAPPPPSYYGSGYYGGYYPGYYPTYYTPAVRYAVYPGRTFINRPVIVRPHGGSMHGGGSFHGGGGHRGRR